MQRPIRIFLAVLAVAGLLAAVTGCAGETSAEQGAVCDRHEDCARGQFCSADGRCAEMDCAVDEDCPGAGVVCLRDISKCSAAECSVGAAAGSEEGCEAGFWCDGGTCVQGGDPPTGDSVGGDDTESGDAKPTGGDVAPPTVAACTECVTDDDCGDAKTCEPIVPGNACLAGCEDDSECGPGWDCFALTHEGSFCVPEDFDCSVTCLIEGCPAGQVCDQELHSDTRGQCIDQLAQCGECGRDWHCADGDRCVTTSTGNRSCVPACPDDTCPDWATCQDKPDQGKVCVPKNPRCCGPDCADVCEPACAAPTPHCLGDTCYECLEDAHCGGGDRTCNPVGHVCEGGLCDGLPSTPYEFEGACVQCLEDAHCAADGTCRADHTCSGGNPCGGMCSGDYPACAVINGVPSCVPCTGDEHCNPGAHCELAIYTCDDAGAVNCNQDCVSGGCPLGTQFDLLCDPQSGCCYDAKGSCDNVVAFCNEASGSTCMNLLEIFGGGALPDLGGTGGSAFSGMCTCDGAMRMLCNALPSLPACEGDVARCYEGASCMAIGQIMSLITSWLGGGGGAVLPGIEDMNFCTEFSLADLLPI